MLSREVQSDEWQRNYTLELKKRAMGSNSSILHCCPSDIETPHKVPYLIADQSASSNPTCICQLVSELGGKEVVTLQMYASKFLELKNLL